MPITTAHFAIGLTRTQIVPPDSQPQHICIHNHEHNSSGVVYVGGPDVTIANGLHAQATLTSQMTLQPGDSLWAISDTAGEELHVLISKQD